MFCVLIRRSKLASPVLFWKSYFEPLSFCLLPNMPHCATPTWMVRKSILLPFRRKDILCFDAPSDARCWAVTPVRKCCTRERNGESWQPIPQLCFSLLVHKAYQSCQATTLSTLPSCCTTTDVAETWPRNPAYGNLRLLARQPLCSCNLGCTPGVKHYFYTHSLVLDSQWALSVEEWVPPSWHAMLSYSTKLVSI